METCIHACEQTHTDPKLLVCQLSCFSKLSSCRKCTLSKNRVALYCAVTSNASACFDQSGNTVHMLFSSIVPSQVIGCKSLTRRHVQYCINPQHVKYTPRHTHTRQFHIKRVLGPETKLIPSILSWSQQNDLKTTFLIILSHQIKRTLRLSKKKKGFSHLPKKAF